MSDLQQLLSGCVPVTPPEQVKTRPVFLSEQEHDTPEFDYTFITIRGNAI